MIELCSCRPDALGVSYEGTLIPISVDEDLSRLSVILLDDAYYELIREGRIAIRGLSCLRPQYLIVMKAKAWLDMIRRKQDGQKIDSRKISKHQNDVLLLYTIVDPGTSINEYIYAR